MVTTSQPAQKRSIRSLLASVLSTRPAALGVDLALVVVRIVTAWIFIYYGGQKLFGWFNGLGFDRTAQLLMEDTANLHPGELFALLGGVIELGGGIALLLGLGTRLVGCALVGDMLMAMITITWANGLHNTTGRSGYELNLALAAVALLLVAFGAGRFSIDALAARRLQA